MLSKTITGIVLAGGKSSRMGTDKCCLSLGGNSLVEIALKKLQAVCPEVVISSNCDHFDLGVPVIKDLMTDCGPLAGIYSVMKTVETEYYLVLPADLPFITKAFLELLITNSADFDAVIPRSAYGFIEPLAAFYNRNCLPVIEASLSSGDFSVWKIFKKLNVKYLDWEKLANFGNTNIFMNLNTPEDFRQAEEIFNNLR